MAQVAKRDPRAMIHEVFTTEFAHMSLDEAVADFPVASINAKAPNVPYTFWHILKHIRIAQTDLLGRLVEEDAHEERIVPWLGDEHDDDPDRIRRVHGRCGERSMAGAGRRRTRHRLDPQTGRDVSRRSMHALAVDGRRRGPRRRGSVLAPAWQSRPAFR